MRRLQTSLDCVSGLLPCFVKNQTWALKLNGLPLGVNDTVRLEVIQQNYNCAPAESELRYAFGNFFNSTRCNDRPLFVLSSREYVSVYALPLSANGNTVITVDPIVNTSAVVFKFPTGTAVLSVMPAHGCLCGHLGMLLIEKTPHTGTLIHDVTLFADELPPPLYYTPRPTDTTPPPLPLTSQPVYVAATVEQLGNLTTYLIDVPGK